MSQVIPIAAGGWTVAPLTPRRTLPVCLAICGVMTPTAAQTPPSSTPPPAEKIAHELSVVLNIPEGAADIRAAMPRLGRFLEKYQDQDLARLSYAPALYLFMNGEYDTAVRSLETYFARYARLPVPAHDRLVGQVYLNAIQEEASRTLLDTARVQGFALRALDLSQPPTTVSSTVQHVLDRGAAPADAAAVRLTLVRHLLADGKLSDHERDHAFRSLYSRARADAPIAIAAEQVPVELQSTSLSGRPVDLRALRGRAVLLHFWASWCPITAAEAPALVRAYERYHTSGFDIVGVALDASDDDSVRQAARRLGFTWEQVHDGSFDGPLAQRFGVETVPFTLLLNQRGVVCARGEEARGEALDKNVAQLLEAKAGKLGGRASEPGRQ